MRTALTTLKDISTELGLSVATVSRALNGFPEVNAKTRALVEDTAKRLNYRPNSLARKLVSGKSGMVGMIVGTDSDLSSDRSFVEIMMGLSARLAERDVDLVFQVSLDDDPVAPYRRLVEKNTLDGFILNAPKLNDPRVEYLTSVGVPFVLHGRLDGAANYPFYDMDNCGASHAAVSLLADLGHKRIALLNGDANFAYSEQRLAGFNSALKARGLTTPPQFVFHGQPDQDYGYTAALAAFSGRLGTVPTGMVCASTLIASGVLKAAGDRGLSIPRDISIVAHDDAIPELRAINLDPGLTVTRAPLRDSCAPLADKLIDFLAGVPAKDLQTTVQPQLIIRNSTGPAAPQGLEPWT